MSDCSSNYKAITLIFHAVRYAGCSINCVSGAFPIAWDYDNATVSSPSPREGLSFSAAEIAPSDSGGQPGAFRDGSMVMAATYCSGRVAAVGGSNMGSNDVAAGDRTMVDGLGYCLHMTTGGRHHAAIVAQGSTPPIHRVDSCFHRNDNKRLSF